jgi:hypothetical protein
MDLVTPKSNERTSSALSQSISPIYLSYQGGAFMGYVGLLLNAPYKIDSMMWMRLVISFVSVFDVYFYGLVRAKWTRWYFRDRYFKMGVIKVLGF